MIQKTKPLRGNRGEWSELYVFAKLLSDGILYQSDLNLEKDERTFYEIIRAYRNEGSSLITYERNKTNSTVIISSSSIDHSISLEIDFFTQLAKITFNGIKEGEGKTFEIPELAPLLETSYISKLTALASSKSDIKLRIFDHRLAKEADLGFSIKSLLGQDSTLFNTGPGNNFIFKFNAKIKESVEQFNQTTYKTTGKTSKITVRLDRLINYYGLAASFDSIQSEQLYKNLRMIDGDLPEILAHALLYRYLFRENSLMGVAKILEEKDPLNFYEGSETDQKFYEYKLKKFLAESAMGMTSEKSWSGVYDTTGGVIICKQDGDIVCFHIYDFNLFRDYLLNNTMFEQPSTGEDENNPGNPRTDKKTKKYFYGWLFEEKRELFLKVNLQIRFS